MAPQWERDRSQDGHGFQQSHSHGPFRVPFFARPQRDEGKPEIGSFWRPTLTIRIVHDFTAFSRGGIPSPLAEHFNIDGQNTLLCLLVLLSLCV